MNNVNNYKKITLFADTINIPVIENNDPMVELNGAIFKVEHKKQDMVPITGNKIFIRKQVAEKLTAVQNQLTKINPDLQLFICYGYRTLTIQQKYFASALERVKKEYENLPEKEYLEHAHSMSAHPDSAGHTVGGAVDLTIWNKKGAVELDMGSKISEFGDIAYTFYPNLTLIQKENRLLLQNIMVKQGLAAFLGEWWHFSFGDKEWAFVYKKPNAIYGPVEISAIEL